jgi:hypothetical protein
VFGAECKARCGCFFRLSALTAKNPWQLSLAFVVFAGAKHLLSAGWFVTDAGCPCPEKMKGMQNIVMIA